MSMNKVHLNASWNMIVSMIDLVFLILVTPTLVQIQQYYGLVQM